MAINTNNFDRVQDTTQLTVNLGNLDSGDVNNPYSYLEWKKRAGIVTPSQLFSAYNNYVRNWYNKRNLVRAVPSTTVLKQEYISLLKKITLSSLTTDERVFIENLDYDNDIDLAIAVPLFAKRLKQIAMYLASKRESVKATKLKYSMVGTKQAIEKILYQHLLTAFTKKQYVTRVYNSDLYETLPQLSSVNNYLNIEIEELFDESNYFDSDTTMAVSAYTADNEFEFVNELLTSSVIDSLANTRNYSATSTNIDAFNKYLGVSHISVSADADGNVTETTIYDPEAPYAHSTNRYFPTVAVIPNITETKTQAEIGGFFTYKSLGVTTYLTTTKAYEYDVGSMNVGEAYIIPDPQFINHGRGLTLQEQSNIVIHEKNLDWVKHDNTNGYHEGTIVDYKNIQRFVPYQSRYETTGIDGIGVERTTDEFDFWTGTSSDIWSNKNIYPLNWRNEFNIAERTAQLNVTTKSLYNWATDIYGNQYGVYKDFTPDVYETVGMYEKKTRTGEIWVRTANNDVNTAPIVLEEVYEKYATINDTIYALLSSNTIRNLDVIKDTLIIEVDNYVLLEKVEFDYDNGAIQSANGGNILSLSSNDNYGGFWYNEDESSITLCVLTQTTSGSNALVYPNLYKVDLDTEVITLIYPFEDSEIESFLLPGSVTITGNERPVISYNPRTQIYNIGVILINEDNGDRYLYSMDILEDTKYQASVSGTPIVYELT